MFSVLALCPAQIVLLTLTNCRIMDKALNLLEFISPSEVELLIISYRVVATTLHIVILPTGGGA